MIEVLEPLFVGELAPYRDVLVLADDPRPSRPVADWLAPAVFEQVLLRYGAPRSADERRGLASEWSKDYLSRLLPPVVAAIVVMGHCLPLSLSSIDLILGETGEPLAFKLPAAGSPWSPTPPDQVGDPFRRFAPLIDDHLEPLVSALSSYSRLSPRVFWSNAANYVEWMVSAIASRMPGIRVDDARAMLELRQRMDGRDNPLYRPVRYLTEGEGSAARTRRQRRVCCVRYLVPDRSLCANCPLSVMPGKSAEMPGFTDTSAD